MMPVLTDFKVIEGVKKLAPLGVNHRDRKVNGIVVYSVSRVPFCDI